LQEAIDLVMKAFDLADLYRNPVMVLVDGFMGQMMEAVEFKAPEKLELPDKKEWAVGYRKERGRRAIVKTLSLEPDPLEEHNRRLQEKYRRIEKNEVRHESYMMDDDVELVMVAYGTTSRIVRSSLKALRAEGIKAGMIRPITAWPFPYEPFKKLPPSVKSVLAVEMSCGQMVEDVKLGVAERFPVHFYGRCGGNAPSVEEVVRAAKETLGR